jgi:hypothetical protein
MAQPYTSDAPSVNLIDLLSNRFAPVQHTLLGMLDARDEATLKCVSKELSTFSNGYRNWDYILEKFFSNAKTFRSLQAEWNALVSGDVVIDFFARTTSFIRNDAHLILMVPMDFQEQARTFLLEEGYTMIPAETIEIDEEYVHPSRSTGFDNQVKISLHKSHISPVYTSLCWRELDLTTCHNFVTWNKAYSLFPYSTFVQNEGYYLKSCMDTVMEDEPRIGAQLRALSLAGYKIKDLAWYGEQEDKIVRSRRFDDKHSWIINLPVQGVTASEIPDGVIASSTFKIKKRDNEDPKDFAGQTYYNCGNQVILKSAVLRHHYLLQYSEGSAYEKKIDSLKRRLSALTFTELAKLPIEDRPPRYRDLRASPRLIYDSRFLGSFTKPPSWTYYDNDVIGFLDRPENESGDER